MWRINGSSLWLLAFFKYGTLIHRFRFILEKLSVRETQEQDLILLAVLVGRHSDIF